MMKETVSMRNLVFAIVLTCRNVIVVCRQYQHLCELMSEQDNWQRYRAKIQNHLLDGTPFIPFLGMFLTQVRQLHTQLMFYLVIT